MRLAKKIPIRGNQVIGCYSRLCWLWAALVLTVLASGCEDASKADRSQAARSPTAEERARKAEVQQYLVNLASDVARWRSYLQGISGRKACADAGSAVAIDDTVAGIIKSLDGLQTRIQTLAQQETLGGDIELLTNLRAISLDAGRLEPLLTCQDPSAKRAASLFTATAAAWRDEATQIRQQASEHAAKMQGQSLALARNSRLASEADRLQARDLVDLVKALAWPIMVVVGLLLFRRPLSGFFEQMAGRITKLSVFEVAIELATLPSGPTPWLDPKVYAGTELFGGAVTSTTIMTLFDRIRDDMVWTYLIVDLKNGKHWLESRLYLFTTILEQMGGLRCVIFVQSNEDYYQRFLGMAKPQDVRRILGSKYAWMGIVFADSLAKSALGPMPLPDNANQLTARLETSFVAELERMPKQSAQSISEQFIVHPSMQTLQDPSNAEWSKLEPANAWDHSHWLTINRFDADLRGVLYDPTLSQFEDTPDLQADERIRALLRRPLPFVAMVNPKGEFQRLIDRQLLVEEVAAKLGQDAAEGRSTAAKKNEFK